jgi:hypothetical protein
MSADYRPPALFRHNNSYYRWDQVLLCTVVSEPGPCSEKLVAVAVLSHPLPEMGTSTIGLVLDEQMVLATDHPMLPANVLADVLERVDAHVATFPLYERETAHAQFKTDQLAIEYAKLIPTLDAHNATARADAQAAVDDFAYAWQQAVGPATEL